MKIHSGIPGLFRAYNQQSTLNRCIPAIQMHVKTSLPIDFYFLNTDTKPNQTTIHILYELKNNTDKWHIQIKTYIYLYVFF